MSTCVEMWACGFLGVRMARERGSRRSGLGGIGSGGEADVRAAFLRQGELPAKSGDQTLKIAQSRVPLL